MNLNCLSTLRYRAKKAGFCDTERRGSNYSNIRLRETPIQQRRCRRATCHLQSGRSRTKGAVAWQRRFAGTSRNGTIYLSVLLYGGCFFQSWVLVCFARSRGRYFVKGTVGSCAQLFPHLQRFLAIKVGSPRVESAAPLVVKRRVVHFFALCPRTGLVDCSRVSSSRQRRRET